MLNFFTAFGVVLIYLAAKLEKGSRFTREKIQALDIALNNFIFWAYW